MSTVTLNTAFGPTAATARPATTRPAKSGVFKSIYAGILAGQEARARAIVRQHLKNYDDDHLMQLGWSAKDIAAMRRGR